MPSNVAPHDRRYRASPFERPEFLVGPASRLGGDVDGKDTVVADLNRREV